MFDSDYSDKDPTHVPDSGENSPKRTADSDKEPTHDLAFNESSANRDLISESLRILQNRNETPEELAKMILETKWNEFGSQSSL